MICDVHQFGIRNGAVTGREVDLLISENILRRSNLSRAHRALFSLLGSDFMRDDTLAALNALSPLDWEELAHLAIARHRVGPIVWNNLQKWPVESIGIPIGIVEKLDATALTVLHDALYAKSESNRIVRALNDVGIEPICLKGWPLEEQLTGTFGRRPLRDLDLLVEKNQMMTAIRAFVDLGYESVDAVYPTSPRRLSFWLNLFKHVELIDRRSGFIVDLHARPFANPRLLPRSKLTFQKIPLATEANAEHCLATPDPISNLLYLSVHGFLHRWERLKWLADLPPLVESLSNADWRHVRERANRLCLTRPIGTGLALARTFLGMKIPEPAQSLVTGLAVRLFCRICIREILSDRDPHRTWRSLSSIAGQLAAEHAVSTDTKTFFASFKPKLVSKQALISSGGLSDDMLFTLYLTRPLSLPSGIWRMFKRN